MNSTTPIPTPADSVFFSRESAQTVMKANAEKDNQRQPPLLPSMATRRKTKLYCLVPPNNVYQ
jgi:hypothetical protein